jgi:hypothetical protein
MKATYYPYANSVAKRVNRLLKQEFLLEDNMMDIEMLALLVKRLFRQISFKGSITYTI